MELKIEGMTCGGCAKSVTKAVHSADSRARVETDPIKRVARIEPAATQAAILKVLDEAGYPASVG